jgi:hypothetical protein
MYKALNTEIWTIGVDRKQVGNLILVGVRYCTRCNHIEARPFASNMKLNDIYWDEITKMIIKTLEKNVKDGTEE